MIPVVLLSDAFLAHGSEPWLIPQTKSLPKIRTHLVEKPNGFKPFKREEHTLARQWGIPGTKGLEHRVGGLEKDIETGDVSYDPINHEKMMY